ncbi:MAG: LptA/OstA family protein [Desulfosarcinaceae bacterium]
MKIFPFKYPIKYPDGIPALIMVTLLAMAALLGAFCPRASAAESDGGAKAEPIRITSDKLVIDNQGSNAEFIGHVKAVQGATEVTADRLTLYYRGAKQPGAESDAGSIEKIHVQGHVRIVFDNRVAVSEQAVYTTSTRTLVLTGQDSRITSDNNMITGDEITFDRNSGRVEVDNKGDGQVRAIIQSDQKGLN